MNENIKALVEKVSGNEEMLAKFSACGSVDEAYELARGIVSGYTKEEFIEAMTALDAAENGDISDADLVAAAGGESTIAESLSKVSEAVTDAESAVYSAIKPVLESIADSATAVSDVLSEPVSVVTKATAQPFIEVGKTMRKSASEIANSISKSANEVSKATKKAFSI